MVSVLFVVTSLFQLLVRVCMSVSSLGCKVASWCRHGNRPLSKPCRQWRRLILNIWFRQCWGRAGNVLRELKAVKKRRYVCNALREYQSMSYQTSNQLEQMGADDSLPDGFWDMEWEDMSPAYH